MRVPSFTTMRRLIASLSAASLLLAFDASAVEKQITDLYVGTAHDAFFGVSLNGDEGVAVGAAGAIFETADAGKSWKAVNEKPIPVSLLAVDWHGKFAIAVGQAGLTMVRVEGTGWRRVDTGNKHRLFSVSVNRFGTAVAAGEFGTLLKTVDGGVTWLPITPNWQEIIKLDDGGGAEPHLYSALIDDAGMITLGGEFGLIMRSKDGGKSWTIVHGPSDKLPSVFAIHLAPPGGGKSYAVGQRGNILVSSNDGTTWDESTSGTQSNFLGVTVDGKGKVIVTGMRVMVTSDDEGATWTPVEEGDTTTDWYQAIRTEKASGRAIAVGHGGKIIAIGG